VTCELSERQYLLPIRGTWEEYCQSRSRRFRKSLSYDRNCCERIGPIELDFRRRMRPAYRDAPAPSLARRFELFGELVTQIVSGGPANGDSQAKAGASAETFRS
jgi:hypothetical protein